MYYHRLWLQLQQNAYRNVVRVFDAKEHATNATILMIDVTAALPARHRNLPRVGSTKDTASSIRSLVSSRTSCEQHGENATD